MTPSGKQIRAARSLAGWERTDLAKKAGLSSVTVRYIENAGGQDTRLYSKYRKNPHIHRNRMTNLVKEGKVTVRFLVKEGDDHLPAAAYAQFKWESEESFVPTSFYAFGDCLALVSFVHERPPYVVLLKSGPFAEVYRQAFNVMWEKARNVPPEILEKARKTHA